MTHHERGLSECVAQILIAFLVILVTLLIIGALTGIIPGLLQKSAFIAVAASPYETGPGTHIISLYHQQGDMVNLNGTSQTAGVSEVAIVIAPPSGSFVPVRSSTPPVHSAAWGPGQYLYIFWDDGYYFADQPPAGEDLAEGEYTIQIIDTKVNVLLHTLPVKIP